MTETLETTGKETPGSDQDPGTTRSWLQLARVASLVIVGWAITLQVLAGELIPPVTIIGIVFAVLAVFLRGERRRLGLAAAVLAAISIAGNLPMNLDELSHPSTPPAFLLTVTAVSASLVIVISGLAAFRGAADAQKRAVYYSWGGLGILAIVIAVGAASGVDSAQPLDDDVQVVASGVQYDTDEIVVTAGENGFWLDNRDGIRHTFTIEELGLEIEAPGLSAQRAEFDLEPGRYRVICTVPGHDNMHIDLVVEG